MIQLWWRRSGLISIETANQWHWHWSSRVRSASLLVILFSAGIFGFVSHLSSDFGTFQPFPPGNLDSIQVYTSKTYFAFCLTHPPACQRLLGPVALHVLRFLSVP